MDRAIIHVDMDAFFASVEQRERPELCGKPVLVGGTGPRSVVATASYEARKFGCRSAMAMAEARARCPNAIVVEPRMDLYRAVSDQVFAIFAGYTPLIEGLSVDEAFLDVSGSQSLFGDAAAIATRVRDQIFADLALTASAGIARNKFAAKLASTMQKPNGQYDLRTNSEGELAARLAMLPIARMWGVGPAALDRLQALGIRTFGDIARRDASWLRRTLGERALHWQALAQGRDGREVESERVAKGASVERTFAADVADREQLRLILLALCDELARRQRGETARTVQIKVRGANFETVSRSAPLPGGIVSDLGLYRVAHGLLTALPAAPVRLLGVGVSGLGTESEQLPFGFDTGGTVPTGARANAVLALQEQAARLGAPVVRADLLAAPDVRRADGQDEKPRKP
jgi:DNA polymerase IV